MFEGYSDMLSLTLAVSKMHQDSTSALQILIQSLGNNFV